MKNIIILASGTGSNAAAIIDYFKDNEEVQVSHVLSNNPKARVLQMAGEKNVENMAFGRKELYKTDEILHFLKKNNPDLIVLAGFLWIIPEKIVRAFPNKIVNIHPALLPKYGGKGMYGEKVHLAVLANQEKETGISIHYVNEFYDEGRLIAQFKTPIAPEDDLKSILAKIKKLEHQYYPKVIDQLLFAQNS
ncbi:MAG TPA: phosphoribosylglycinamide formyltransferase [Flavobacteriaceae bacterium]|nr:phosphoribosylglycinamide formyltransferase [Flavobacteriaceae bacterium]